MSKSDRGPSKNYLCEDGLMVSEEMKLLKHDARFKTHAGQGPVTIAHVNTSSSGELKMTINGHFTVKSVYFCLDIIKHGCLTNMVSALNPNNSVIKRLWYICREGNFVKKYFWLSCQQRSTYSQKNLLPSGASSFP